MGTKESGMWMGVSHIMGWLIWYHVLTAAGKVTSAILMQRITNMEIQTNCVKRAFATLDVHTSNMLQSPYHGYNSAKPIPEYWTDMMYDEEFYE